MLSILLDTAALWLLLNFLTDENWDDEKLKVFLMALSISVVGVFASVAVVEYLGVFAVGVYFAIGVFVLWVVGDIGLRRGSIIMLAFTAYKIVMVLALTAIFKS